jgi:hypothetical protein
MCNTDCSTHADECAVQNWGKKNTLPKLSTTIIKVIFYNESVLRFSIDKGGLNHESFHVASSVRLTFLRRIDVNTCQKNCRLLHCNYSSSSHCNRLPDNVQNVYFNLINCKSNVQNLILLNQYINYLNHLILIKSLASEPINNGRHLELIASNT